MTSVAVDKFGVVGKNVCKWIYLLCKNLLIVSLGTSVRLKFRYLGSFSSDYVPTLDNVTFAIYNTQPSHLRGGHWIMNSIFRYELYFADSLGCKGYSFLNNQHYKQMMPAPVQSYPSVCGCYTINATFHIFKFRQEARGSRC